MVIVPNVRNTEKYKTMDNLRLNKFEYNSLVSIGKLFFEVSITHIWGNHHG